MRLKLILFSLSETVEEPKNSAFLRFPNFAGSKMDLTSKYREEVALILIKAGVEHLETTVACLQFPAVTAS